MIIDLILDRKEGAKYSPSTFYRAVVEYGEVGFEIAHALDFHREQFIKEALCKYIQDNEYNHEICKYINSQNWL